MIAYQSKIQQKKKKLKGADQKLQKNKSDSKIYTILIPINYHLLFLLHPHQNRTAVEFHLFGKKWPNSNFLNRSPNKICTPDLSFSPCYSILLLLLLSR
jgi:hypothetical protein